MIENPDMEPRLVESLKEAGRILVFTGAGISTASGIPDFRGPRGLWKTSRPINYQEFLSSEDARLKYWESKLGSWRNHRDALPTRVHRAMVRIEEAGRLAMLVTQNVDGLHGRAGTSPERLVELHGTNLEVECQGCKRRSHPEAHYRYVEEHHRPPVCECGGLLKPATISFGQALRQEDLERAFNAARACDLVIALGSTLSVTPAANVPLVAAERGAPYVIINQGETDHDGLPLVSLRLEEDVQDVFPPAVEEALK